MNSTKTDSQFAYSTVSALLWVSVAQFVFLLYVFAQFHGAAQWVALAFAIIEGVSLLSALITKAITGAVLSALNKQAKVDKRPTF